MTNIEDLLDGYLRSHKKAGLQVEFEKEKGVTQPGNKRKPEK